MNLEFIKHDILLISLVEDCKKYWLNKRIVIIPNCSGEYKLLTGKLDEHNIRYVLDNTGSELIPKNDFYVIDFREINLIR